MARNDIDRIVNACDSGREGELIFRLIYDLAECKKPVMRMWFNSMTSEAIRDAYRGMLPGSRFDALADAAYCRTEGDYLVGINGSRGVTRLYERQTSKAEIRSVGRVQTPTGALVYDREVAIRTFKAKDYWEVHGEFGVAAGSYIGKWIAPERETPGDAPEGSSDGQAELDHQYRIFDKGRAEAILTRCTGVAPSDVKQESKPATKGSPKLYDLTLLQREANKKLGLTSKQTDTIAQALYEKHKVTTYPRTDSCFLPEDYIAKAKSVIEALVETPYRDHATRILSNGWIKPDKRIFDNSKISDHFAIIPTGKMPEGLSPDEEKVYDLVVKRFLSVFHPAAQYEVTTRLTIIAGEHFKSSGRVLVDPGWLAVYGTQTQDDDKKIPALTKYVPGESVSTEGMELKTLKTKPPVRYTLDDKAGNPVAKAAARPCPKCGHDMNRIPWQKRHFWACSDREQCKHTMDDKDGVPVEKAQSFPCPDCSKPMYRRQRRDQKGYFWGCSGYQKDGSGCSCMLEDRDGKPVPKATAPNIQDDRTFL